MISKACENPAHGAMVWSVIVEFPGHTHFLCQCCYVIGMQIDI